MYSDEQMEQIADKAVETLIKQGMVVEGRAQGSPVYIKPDATLIRAILSAYKSSRYKLAVALDPDRDRVIESITDRVDEVIKEMEYE